MIDFIVLGGKLFFMDCLPLDDACIWQRIEYELLVKPGEDYYIDTHSIDLGTFNGRTYTYTWFGKQPVIFIEQVDAPANARPEVLEF